MRFILIFFLLFSSFISNAKCNISPENKNYFGSPLKIPLLLSGNFGELRSNNFHAGIDIKTQGKIGLQVCAAADGYISRIKISPYGYGLALYINHPNGFTTVYGHLSQFAPAIEKYAREEQYRTEKFDIDINIPANVFVVKKGEYIALSGNTGGSGGPHLHFEIRETISEHPINPLLFNFNIKDTTPPLIKSLMVYPISPNASVNGKHAQQDFTVTNNTIPEKISANGTIGLGIYADETLDGSANKCGIFECALQVNNETIYTFKMDELDFDERRYANSYMDYAYFKKNNIRYQKSFVDKNNQLNNFETLINNGTFSIQESDTANIKYLISDTYGNNSSLRFQIFGEKDKENPNKILNGTFIKCQEEIQLETENSKLLFDKNTFYNDLYIDYSESTLPNSIHAPHITIGNELIPAHRNFELQIKAHNIPNKYIEKVGIALIDKYGKIKQFTPAKNNDNWICGSINTLGKYTVAIDSIKPEIKALSIDNNQSLNNPNQLNFLISDNLSGIQSWRGEIDGEWVLFQYEYKQKKLFYIFDNSRLKMNQKHSLKLSVVDAAGNSANYEASFFK
ncbi:MAG: M23 family metallopeptidase [Mangrovibacterium sp.]